MGSCERLVYVADVSQLLGTLEVKFMHSEPAKTSGKEFAKLLALVFVSSLAGLTYLFGWGMIGLAALVTLGWLGFVLALAALHQRQRDKVTPVLAVVPPSEAVLVEVPAANDSGVRISEPVLPFDPPHAA